MRLTLLGTGTSTGVPIPGCNCAVCASTDPRNKRLRTSAVLRLDSGQNILIDASTDLRQQALAHGVKRVDAVLFTHAHADHILGIEDLRSFNFIQKSAIPCYLADTARSEITRFFKYIFDPDPNYQGGLLTQLSLHQIVNTVPFTVCGVQVTPFELHHGKLSITGFRIGDLAYATDCNFIPDDSFSIIAGVKTLVLDALRHEGHRTHFTVPQAVAIAQRVGAQQTYFIHMSHAVEHERDSKLLPAGIAFGYDGLDIEIGADKG